MAVYHKKETHFTYNSQFTTAFNKVYIEQFLYGTERQEYTMLKASKDRTPKVLKAMEEYAKIARQRFKEHIENADPDKYFIVGIDHDADFKPDKDDFRKSVPEVEHFHFYFHRIDDKRFRVGTMLKILGIEFTEEDKTLFNHGGVDSSLTANRPNLLMYLTHDTPKSIEDGKHHYKVEELVSNQPLEKVLAERNKFTGAHKCKKLTDTQWDSFILKANELGYNLGDFDRWADEYFTAKQQASSTFRVVEKHYNMGLQKRMGKKPAITRCCVYIWGAHDLGKTYTTNKALNNLHENVYIAGKGSGKYDGVTASTTAITFDDTPSSDALNVFDNFIKPLHRRNSGDRPWRGSYAVATNNATPSTWMSQMLRLPYDDPQAFNNGHYVNESDDELYQALISRFYICHIENNHLVVDSIENRGTMDDHKAHDKLFLRFANEFNKELQHYAKHTGYKDARLYSSNEEAGKQAEMIAKRLGEDWLSHELKNEYSSWKLSQREEYAFRNRDNPYTDHSKVIDNTFLLTPPRYTKNEEGNMKTEARRYQMELDKHENSLRLRIEKRLNVRKTKNKEFHKRAK